MHIFFGDMPEANPLIVF